MSDEPIVWRGNLRDDCTAEWRGLMLRAEMMDRGVWWWAVYGPDRKGPEIDASWNHPPTRTGKGARNHAERAARWHLANIGAPVQPGEPAEPMPRPLTLILPMPENIANGKLRGWRGVAARKKRYYADLDRRQAAGLIPPPPARAFARASIRATMHLGAAMDAGNAMHRCEKWPCDWLKTRGYIVDDKPSCLAWEGLPTQIVKRTREYRIEFTLTPIAA